MIQLRPDAQMRLAYSHEEALTIALAAIAMLKAVLRNPTVELREQAVSALLDEAPTFAHRKALQGAALYLLIERWEA